jgi:uncharacterized protein YbjT (DUF2867 family)
MRVFVKGGTGAIRGHTVPALVAAGHEATAMARAHHSNYPTVSIE